MLADEGRADLVQIPMWALSRGSWCLPGATLTGRTEATLRPVCMEAEERKAGGGADRKAREETADRRANPGVRLGTLASQGGETQGLPPGF